MNLCKKTHSNSNPEDKQLGSWLFIARWLDIVVQKRRKKQIDLINFDCIITDYVVLGHLY